MPADQCVCAVPKPCLWRFRRDCTMAWNTETAAAWHLTSVPPPVFQQRGFDPLPHHHDALWLWRPVTTAGSSLEQAAHSVSRASLTCRWWLSFARLVESVRRSLCPPVARQTMSNAFRSSHLYPAPLPPPPPPSPPLLLQQDSQSSLVQCTIFWAEQPVEAVRLRRRLPQNFTGHIFRLPYTGP